MNPFVRITVLVENTAGASGLLAEHGFALWVEYGRTKVLFDTGQGGVLLGNAYKLGISLAEAGAIVLSHGHYDHTGGLPDALRGGGAIEVFLHPAALEPKYACTPKGAREIGMPFPAAEALRSPRVTLHRAEGPTAVLPGLALTGPVPRTTDFEDTGGPFFLDAGGTRPDPLVDDQALFFTAADGVVVLLGCAHAGVVNTLRYIEELTNGKPVVAVLGGMHLGGASPERLRRTLDELRQRDLRLLAPAHCTGMTATAAIWNAFPDQCRTCHVGDTFTFDLP